VVGDGAAAAAVTNEPGRPGPGASGRDPFIDFVRAFSLLIVVLWHWVFTILLWNPDGPHASNPIGFTRGLFLVTWLFQVMPLFFFVVTPTPWPGSGPPTERSRPGGTAGGRRCGGSRSGVCANCSCRRWHYSACGSASASSSPVSTT
jgi:hypothetical protein